MSFHWREREMKPARSGDLGDIIVGLIAGALMSLLPEAAAAEPTDPPAEAGAIQSDTPKSAGPLPELPSASKPSVREYGPSRPGMGTPPSTIEPGHVSIEVALVDWQRDDQPGIRADTLLAGATTVRLGITTQAELLASWVPFGHVRVRDTATDEVSQANRIGDAAIGFKQNLRNPDGAGLSFAAQPFVVLPVGSDPVGAGRWGGGVVLPASYAVSETLSLQLTPEVDLAADNDGQGHHLTYSLVGGVGLQIAKPVQITFELAGQRDLDPLEPSTRVFGGASVGWKFADNLQFDVGGTVGLNRYAADHRIYAGTSRRF